MEATGRTFVPAAGLDWCLPLYDPLVRLLGGDQARRALLEQAALRPGHAVLDVGCGTGSLATLVKGLHPGVQVTGVDPDPKALERARRKAARANVSVRLDRGFADALPYPDASFDRVLSSFVFHHLQEDEKGWMLSEARRVLKPGGSLHLLDFAGHEPGVLTLMREAGLQEPTRLLRGTMVLGLLAYSSYRASAPSPEARDAR